MKLTKWYPPEVKPKRRGVYITQTQASKVRDSETFFQYWSGTFWKARSGTICGADSMKEFNSIHQEVYWKGIQR
jgi:hypothetical protein